MLIETLKVINKWVLRDSDIENANKLQHQLKVHPIICELLVQRGISSYEEAKQFFRPSLENLHNPFLMKGMENAIERIHKAIENREKILIYGDYDVDGTTSVALAYTFFRSFTDQIHYYIPDRYDEGYGVSPTGIQWAKDNDYSLIITLDCGITAVEEVELANSLGIDVIIGDHHLPGSRIPNAIACLDPKQEDCNYPFKELSGCGIGFKICEAYAIKHNINLDKVYDLVDFVVISIASDIVPIVDENRILAYYGLQKINEDPRPGIKVIFDMLRLDKEITISDLVFTIGPRINAAGRMKHASLAVEMLIDRGSLQLDKKAQVLNKNNLKRRTIDRDITEDALDKIKQCEKLQNAFSTVLYSPDWHKGVIGIVASRLIENYYRPTIILTKSNGLLTGSARSVKGFSIYDALQKCSHLLETFGGHKYAAGLSLQEEQLEEFTNLFEQVVKDSIQSDCLHPEINIDREISLDEINEKFYSIIKQFAPFGPGNMRPVFLIRGLEDAGRSRKIKQDHIKINVKHPEKHYYYDGIGFNLADKFTCLKNGSFDACFTLDENYWNGKTTIQMKLKDIKETTTNTIEVKS